ncbi:MAG: ABC transporter ATP-binding protein [Burkholderiales bacterium]|nr:ABC transporter ATP-binding protein [Phycisphaerae bacterium]
MADPSLALELTHIDKRYGRRVHALKGISLNVARGEVFGLLGPNGAGKSTLVKILMTVVKPTRAQGFLLGEPVGTKSALRRVGYLPENHRFPKYLTGRQTLEFFASLSGADRAWRKKRLPELLDLVGMTAWADQKVGAYSKGMMQRVGIAQALAADPELVVLDEPTDGVDPVGRRDIRDLLVRLKHDGKTVFINSHLLSELEMVCDRVAIMVAGQVTRYGTIAELAVSRRCYEIELDAASPDAFKSLGIVIRESTGPSGTGESVSAPPPLPAGKISIKGTLPDGRWTEQIGNVLRVGEPEATNVQALLDQLRAGGNVIRRVQPVQPTLEELFMEAVAEVTGDDQYAAGATLK